MPLPVFYLKHDFHRHKSTETESNRRNAVFQTKFRELDEVHSCGQHFFLFIYRASEEPSPLSLRPFTDLFYQPSTIDGDDCGAISGMNECQRKPKYLE
jgi:hypothetical protein